MATTAKEKRSSIAGSRQKTIRLDKIRLDGDTQSRKSLDDDVIKEYSQLMAEGREFPPLDVVFDGADYWLYDGFHRRWAGISAKIESMKCRVVEGTREDARWLSYAANKDHGWPRNNDDKKKAVITAIKHPKGAKKSDVQIAEHVGVSDKTVAKYRSQLQATSEIPKSTERTGQDGRTINTANIGKSKPKTEPEPEREDDQPAEDAREETADAIGQAFVAAGAKQVDLPPPKPAEPNTIGELKERITDFIDRLIADQPAHVRVAVAEHLEELAAAIR